MDKSKKGISPLIATVLIIGFTVALATVIMTWGTKFTKDIQESTSSSANANMVCAQDVTLTIKNICKDSASGYKIIVSNDGRYDLVDYKVRFYKNENDITTLKRKSGGATITSLEVASISTAADVDGDGIADGDLEIGFDYQLQRVELIPTVTVGGKNVVCAQNLISFGEAGSNAEGSTIGQSDC